MSIFNSNKLLKTNKQNEYFKSNINNLIKQSSYKSIPVFSNFLENHQQIEARKILVHNDCKNFSFFGGAENCEHMVLGIFPDNVPINNAYFPIAALKISNTANVFLSHRDYLGALMSLQIKREFIGDIIIDKNTAVILLLNVIVPFIKINLTKISRFSVCTQEIPCDELKIYHEYKLISGTVPSLRLDCLISMIINTSRRIAEKTITARLVKVNGKEISNGSKQLTPGDTIVIRGKGKFIICDEYKKTKKSRLFITVKKLV